MNNSVATNTNSETNTSSTIPFILVLSCAIMEPLLINGMMERMNFDNSLIFIWISHIVIGSWIIVIWLLLALIPHLFSLLYNAEGRFKPFLVYVGYGFIPMILGIAVSYYILNHSVLPNTTDLNMVRKDLTIKLISQINTISMSLTIPWVIYSIYKLKTLTLIQSVICVLLPFSIVFLLSNLFSRLLS